MSGGTRSRSPHVRNVSPSPSPSSPELELALGGAHPTPAGSYVKTEPQVAVTQPITKVIEKQLPRRSLPRRVVHWLVQLDRRCSVALHASSLYPFDLLLVPFAMVCGIYSMPIVIPIVGIFESERLGAVLLASVSDNNRGKQNVRGSRSCICFHFLSSATLFFLFAASLLTTALTTAGKRLTKRLRPCPSSLARKFFDLRRLETNFSFPSGDSAQGAVLACNLFFYVHAYQRHAALAADGALLSSAVIPAFYFLYLIPFVCAARVYFGAHWWSDTAAGALIGWVSTEVCWLTAEHALGWRFGRDDYRTRRILTRLGFLHP